MIQAHARGFLGSRLAAPQPCKCPPRRRAALGFAPATGTPRLHHTVAPTPLRQHVATNAAEVSQTVSTEQQEQPEFSVELPTADVQAAVQLMGVVQGRGAAIVIAAVEPGSAAASAGVRPGQQLLAVSNPIRRSEMWQLNPQASLRYTRQAIRMRVADSITLRLTARPIPEWADVVAAKRSASAAAAAAAAAGAAAGSAADDEPAEEAPADDLLSAIARSIDEADSGASPSPSSAASSASTSTSAGPAGQGLTVAEKLELQYAQQQQAEADPLLQRQLTDLERRQRRRKEYFEQASKRNDAPFFAAVAALFVLPPAAILLWAFTSGYVDSLDMYGMLR